MPVTRMSLFPESRNELWRPAMVSGLLVRVCELDQRRLAVGAPEDRQTDRQSTYGSRGHSDVRVARDCGGCGVAAAVMISGNQIRQPGGPASRSNQGVEIVLGHRRVDALFAR